jgi:glucose/arabinose dehydrogenase
MQSYMLLVLFVLIVIVIFSLTENNILFNKLFTNVNAAREQDNILPMISSDPDLKVQIVYDKLQFPTSMAFLGHNDILVLEKDRGMVRRIINGNMLPDPLLDVSVANENERGILGIAILKTGVMGTQENQINYKNYIFVYFTELKGDKDGKDKENQLEPLGNRLYRYELRNDKLVNPKLLLDLPAVPNRHNGGSVLVGPDNNVYVSIGDVNHNTTAQNIENGPPADGTGGILRVTKEGNEVENGILGQKDLLKRYYAYGIRNNFGMDFDPETGILWATEDGFHNIDELNLVEPGFNSGWKDVQGFIDLDATDPEIERRSKEMIGDFEDFSGKGKYSDPKFVWNHSVTPTSVKFLNSDKYGEEYKNDLFIGDFNYGNLYHFELDEERKDLILEGALADKISNSIDDLKSIIFGQGFGEKTDLYIKKHNYFGGITDIEVGPDGYLYILTFGETNGTIYKILPP